MKPADEALLLIVSVIVALGVIAWAHNHRKPVRVLPQMRIHLRELPEPTGIVV